MIFFVLICRDSHDIDDIFRKLTALYVGSTIYLYPVKPLDRQRSKGLPLIIQCHQTPGTRNEAIHILDHGVSNDLRPRYQSVFPKRKEEELKSVCKHGTYRLFVLKKESLKKWESLNGIKRKSQEIYHEINKTLHSFLKTLIADSVKHCKNDNRNTITLVDVLTSISTTSYFHEKKKQLINELISSLVNQKVSLVCEARFTNATILKLMEKGKNIDVKEI